MNQENYTNNKKDAVITGIFFIIATVAAIIGKISYDPILEQANYIQNAAQDYTQIMSGAVFELILVSSACGTAIMLLPYLRKYDEHLGIAYFCFRVLEAILILIGVVAILSILTLSSSFVNDSRVTLIAYQSAGFFAKAIHDWTFILGPLFFLGINTCIYSYVFFRTQLVPPKLAVLGILGAILVFISALLVMFKIILLHSTIQILMAMPIAFYEMILAGWLIIKGFNTSFLKFVELEPQRT